VNATAVNILSRKPVDMCTVHPFNMLSDPPDIAHVERNVLKYEKLEL
jgi:hypothetical protein